MMAVKAELKKLGIPYRKVDLGVVETNYDVSVGKLELLSNDLLQLGFEVIRSRKEIISEKIANAIIDLIHYSNNPVKTNLSDFLSEKLNYEYSFLLSVFSEVRGTSIEKFYITHRIERVKELLRYNELSVQEISTLTNYSSVSHLSSQFKIKTGMLPTEYRKLGSKNSTLVKGEDLQLPAINNNELIQRNAGRFLEKNDSFLIYG